MVLCRLFTGYLEPILFNVHVYCKVGYLVIPVSLCLSPNMMVPGGTRRISLGMTWPTCCSSRYLPTTQQAAGQVRASPAGQQAVGPGKDLPQLQSHKLLVELLVDLQYMRSQT